VTEKKHYQPRKYYQHALAGLQPKLHMFSVQFQLLKFSEVFFMLLSAHHDPWAHASWVWVP